MSARLRNLPRRRLSALAGILLALALAAGAIAYFTSTGTGTAAASVGTLNPPSNVTAQQAGADVTVSWSAATLSSGAAVQGYRVTRSDGTTVCGSPTPVTTLSCTDTSVPAGSYTYTVTAVYHGFTAHASSASLTILSAPTITAKPSDPSANADPSFTFSGGGGSSYQCQLDSGSFTACSSPDAPSGLNDGSHTFKVHATQSGSSGPDSTYTWTVDASAPTITAKPANPSNDASPLFSFTHTQSGYTFKCQLDSGGYSACTSPQAYSALGEGAHTFDVEAIDADGVATKVASYAWSIDTIPPQTTITLTPSSPNGSAGWYTSAPSFTLNATDTGGSGVASTFYQIDGGAQQTYSSAVSVPEGQHTITYWSTDNAGNNETVHATATIKVDTTKPTAALSLGAPTGAYLAATTLYYNGGAAGSFNVTDTVTDAGSGPASASFPDISTTGWTHTAETLTTPSGGPYNSSNFSWSANPADPTGYTTTSTDTAGNTTITPLSFVDDTTAPTGGALSVNGTAATAAGSSSTATSTSFPIDSRTDYTDNQSGVASSTLTIQSETLTGSTCGTPGSGGPFTTTTTITGTTQPSGITAGNCYLYTLTGTDHVGNSATLSTTVQVTKPPPTVTNSTNSTIDLPVGIAAGSDGALWFTNRGNNSIGRITTSGTVTNYTGTGINDPTGIAAGPDGALWFTNQGGNSIGRISTSGTVTNYTGTGISYPSWIAAGSDGALWFTNYANSSIGRITTSGTVTNYTGTGISEPTGIAAGSDGALWFTNYANGSIGRITTSGTVTNYTSTGICVPDGITAGPDSALWFTDLCGWIGRIDPSTHTVTNYTNSTISTPWGITAGPDGALWFTNRGNNSIGRITTAGTVTNYTNSTISIPSGITAGPDGALWFTNYGNNSIGRITTP